MLFCRNLRGLREAIMYWIAGKGYTVTQFWGHMYRSEMACTAISKQVGWLVSSGGTLNRTPYLKNHICQPQTCTHTCARLRWTEHWRTTGTWKPFVWREYVAWEKGWCMVCVCVCVQVPDCFYHTDYFILCRQRGIIKLSTSCHIYL